MVRTNLIYFSPLGSLVKLLLLLVLFVPSADLSAQLTSAELRYNSEPSGKVEVTLVNHYRCGADRIPSQQPVLLVEVMAKGARQNLQLTEISRKEVEGSANASCKIKADCLIEVQYKAEIELAKVPGGYDLVWRQCCIGEEFANYPIMGEKGFALVCSIPELALTEGNASPKFDSNPFSRFCSGQETMSLTQIRDERDNDSLVVIASPIKSDVSLAIQPLETIRDPQHPDFVPVPPLKMLEPKADYDYKHPFGKQSVFDIDQTAALIKLKVDNTGKYLIGITIEEYRNDLKIGSTQRILIAETN